MLILPRGCFFALALMLIVAALPAAAQESARPANWSDASHDNSAPIDYDLILPDDRINELYIAFSPEAWQAEEADMLEIYGERGTGGRGAFPGPGGPGRPALADIAEIAELLNRSDDAVREALALIPDFAAVSENLGMSIPEIMAAIALPGGFAPPTGEAGPGGRPRFPGRGAGAGESPVRLELARNPIWVPVTIQFGDEVWNEVGFRYKGNSTLASGWRTGKSDLPFKLDFDEFEDAHPELRNQRFYGFKQLSFSRSDFDPSLQREKVAADIFRAAGVPAPETAFYAVYVDDAQGKGFDFWGLYTAIELPDDTLIETQFASDEGNMYKPSGSGAAFMAGSFNEVSFDKETNRSSGYEDILALFEALHDPARLSDPALWRSQLETVFNVEVFLRWLAANTLIQNWDTYGAMPHNYYLYADEATERLTWIPWDNNMALSSTAGLRSPLSLDMQVEPDAWPLIGYLMEQPGYASQYDEALAEISAEIFTPERMTAIYESNFAMLSSYLRDMARDDIEALREATDELIEHVHERAQAAADYLANRA